jgi:hypothetical protein
VKWMHTEYSSEDLKGGKYLASLSGHGRVFHRIYCLRVGSSGGLLWPQ